MNLSVLQENTATQERRLELKQPPWAGQTFRVQFRPCLNPLCPCTNMSFICELVTGPEASASAPASPYCFTLDVEKRQVTPSPNDATHPDSPALAAAVVREFTNDDWRVLWQYFISLKFEQQQKIDLTKVAPRFPDDALRANGAMAGFAEIFPFDQGFPFDLGSTKWVTDDQYCVQPRCACHDTVLTFLPLPDEGGHPLLVTPETTAVRYDYHSGRFEPLTPPSVGQPPLQTLIDTLKQAYPNLNRDLAKRHGQLRLLSKRAQQKQLPPPLTRVKVGRNDPCPCGSGKKYKKCCGSRLSPK